MASNDGINRNVGMVALASGFGGWLFIQSITALWWAHRGVAYGGIPLASNIYNLNVGSKTGYGFQGAFLLAGTIACFVGAAFAHTRGEEVGKGE